ncbi:MAG: DUF790 family protein [Planctomycetes bacterium]|nr:DUF790 family protein [Planctomycetota bacterium]
MLTADLLQAKVRKGVVEPRYLPTEGPEAAGWQELAQALIDTYVAHVGQPRHALEQALDDLTAGRPDFKVCKGFRKLLDDRSDWAGLTPAVAAERRQALFARAAALRAAGAFDRAQALREAAAELGVEEAELEGSLYGDLKLNELLRAHEPWSAAQFVDRYNLALAQATLLRAQSLKVTVRGAPPERLRQLVRNVKFHGLLTLCAREGDTLRLELDGPLSLFEATPRYGVRMAQFLPTLLLCADWSLEATVQLGKGRRMRAFRLDPSAALKTHSRDVGAWTPEVVPAFAARFAEVVKGWTIDTAVEPLILGQTVVVPDFRFVHAESGWVGYLEVLGYWRRTSVTRRLEAIEAHDAPLLLALEKGLKVDGADLAKRPCVIPFREVPDARKVRKGLEALRATAPTAR